MKAEFAQVDVLDMDAMMAFLISNSVICLNVAGKSVKFYTLELYCDIYVNPLDSKKQWCEEACKRLPPEVANGSCSAAPTANY